MGYNTKRIKARAEELVEGYEDARDMAFNDEFKDMFMEHFVGKTLPHNTINEDDIQGFLDSFSFPDEDEWAFDQVQSELDDIGDQKMEEYKDGLMGL